MRLELAERLICPAAHETTPLIVIAHESSGRDLRRAQLGCMLCRREGEVRDGSVLLAPFAPGIERSRPQDLPSDDQLLRLAALLGLSEANALVLLSNHYVAFAPLLAERHEAIVAVFDADSASPPGVGHLLVAEDSVPFASGSFAAATLDASMTSAVVADVIRCVRIGGRIVGESGVKLPLGVRELARDADGWVGEVEAAASAIIPLRRA